MSTDASSSLCPRCDRALPPGKTEDDCPSCMLQLAFFGHGENSRGVGIADADEFVPSSQYLQVRDFGDYELLEEVARGGMGVVFRARQRSLNRTVAVKMIVSGQLASKSAVRRFRREAEAAAKLDHPNIVPIYEVGVEDDQHFYSMKLVEGKNLAQALPRIVVGRGSRDPAGERRVARLMTKIAEALAFAHHHGVLHRDLKPSNILIDGAGEPHLTDFGLAKIVGDEEEGLTVTAGVLGSPCYMAPEQASGGGDAVTTDTDVYGLGVVLYEMLTGRPPFKGKTTVEVIRQVVDREVDPPRKQVPHLSRDIETICLKCLQKEPAARYESAKSVADELGRFVRGEPIQARPVGDGERLVRWAQRNPALAVLSVVAVLAVVLGFSGILWQNRVAVAEAARANAALEEKASALNRLRWELVSGLLADDKPALALAQLAQVLREDPGEWRAATYALTILQEHAQPVPVTRLDSRRDALSSVAFSDDGAMLATAGQGAHAAVWSLAEATEIQSVKTTGISPKNVEFSSDGTVLLVSGINGVRVWDIGSGEPTTPTFHAGMGISFATFHADGATVASSAIGHHLPPDNRIVAPVSRWVARSGAPVFQGHKIPMRGWGLCASSDGKKIAVTGESHGEGQGYVIIFDAESGRELGRIKGDASCYMDAAFSPDSRQILTVPFGSKLELWGRRDVRAGGNVLRTGAKTERGVLQP